MQQNSADSSDDDMEKAVTREVEALSKTRGTARRFQAVTTKTNNCLFISTTLERPDEVVEKIFLDAIETHESKSRFILKIFPVLGTCRATEDKIEKLAEEIMSPFISSCKKEVPTYATIYKVRCNNLSRETILPLIGSVMVRLKPTIRVNFDDPDFVVSVDVLQKICCISVLRNFYRYRKYNIQELANLSIKTPTEKTKTATMKNEPEVNKSSEMDSHVTRGKNTIESCNDDNKLDKSGVEESVKNELPTHAILESIGKEIPDVTCTGTPQDSLNDLKLHSKLDSESPETNLAECAEDK